MERPKMLWREKELEEQVNLKQTINPAAFILALPIFSVCIADQKFQRNKKELLLFICC